jgi:hypothetical protein
MCVESMYVSALQFIRSLNLPDRPIETCFVSRLTVSFLCNNSVVLCRCFLSTFRFEKPFRHGELNYTR